MANKVVGFEIRFEGFTELIKLNDSLKDQKKLLADLRKSHGETSDEYLKQAEVVGKLQAEIKQKRIEQSKEIAEQKKAAAEVEKAIANAEKLAEKEAKQAAEIIKNSNAYNDKVTALKELTLAYKAAIVSGETESKTTKDLAESIKKLTFEIGLADAATKDLTVVKKAEVVQVEKAVSAYDEKKKTLAELTKDYKNLSIEGKGLSNEAIDLANKIKELTNEIKATDEATKELTKTEKVEVIQTEKVLNAYDEKKKVLKELTNDYKALASEGKANTDEAKLLANQIAKLSHDIKKADDATKEITKTTKKELDAYQLKSNTLNELRHKYKALAASEGATTDEAKRLLKEIQKLDKELKGIDASVGQHQRKVGEYGSAFEGLSGIMTGSLSSALSATGVGMAAVAGIELAGEIVSQVKEITDEFIQLRGEIQQLTNVTGAELDNFTISVSAIADTFGKDTNEVTLAANALAKNMGISFDESLKLIEQGFLSGADANGEFLDSVREYPSFFKDAGLSGEQFIATITQQIQSGVFSDKGIDAFKEAKLQLTELPKTAQDALTAIGLSSDDIRKQIEKDGVGAAIQTVSKQLGTLEKDSPAVGQAIAGIFGGAGEDAGASFIIDSFSNMDTKMVDLIDTSNGLTSKQLTLLEANKGLATAQNELTLALSGSGISLDALGINIKTLAINGLIELINIVKDTIGIFAPFFDLVSDVGKSLGVTSEKASFLSSAMDFLGNPLKRVSKLISGLASAASVASEKIREFLVFTGVLDETQKKVAKSGKKTVKVTVEQSKATKKNTEATKEATKEKSKYNATTSKSNATRKESAKQIEAESGSIKDLTSKISKLRQEIDNSSDENAIAAKLKEISNYETQLEATKQKIEDLSEALKRANNATGAGTEELGRSTLPTFLDSDLVEIEKQKSEKKILDYLGKTSKFTKEYNEQQNILNAEKYAADFENEQLFFTKRLDALDLFYETGLLKEEEYNEKKKELNQEIFDYSVNIANESIKTIGMIQDARMAKELAQAGDNEAAKEEIEKKYAKKKQNLAVVQAIIDGASGIVKTGANLGYPLAIPFQVLQGIQTIAQIAAIKAQKFATGGRVKGSNIPTQANGDSVLATLKPREIVLTESDQNVLGGVATFDKLVNGRNRFATGGMVAPTVIPKVQRETSLNTVQNNDAIFDLINAVNDRIDRIEVIADPSQIVKQGGKQIKKAEMMEV